MADVSFVGDDADLSSPDIVVHNPNGPTPKANAPVGNASPAGAPGAGSPGGWSYNDFAGVKGASSIQVPAQAAGQAGGAPAGGGWSYADFAGAPKDESGPLSNAPNDSYLSGALKGAATAAIRAAGSAAGGFAGDLGSLTDYLMARGQSAVTGEDVNSILQRFAQQRAQVAADEAKNIGVSPGVDLPTSEQMASPILSRTGEYEPTSEPGRIAQTALQAGLSALGPGGGAGSARTLAAAAPAVAASAGVGQGVSDVTGSPLAGIVASLAAGPAYEATKAGVTRVAQPIAAGLPGRIGEGASENMAANELGNSATDLSAARQSLSNPQPELVEGSQPTTGQLTGDMGLLSLERSKRNVGDNGLAFNQREAQQNAARLAQIGSVAHPNADALAAPNAFRARFTRLDTALRQAVDELTRRAQVGAEGLGKGAPAEARGNTIRRAVEGAREAARAEKTRLYEAIDPENKLNIVAQDVRDGAKRIAGELGPYDEPMAGKEASIFKDAAGMPDVMKFNDLRAFDKRVTTAMREAKRGGDFEGHRRLSQLKGAVQDAIDQGVENQIAYEVGALARGEVRTQDTIEHRLAEDWNLGASSGRESDAGAMVAQSGNRAEPLAEMDASGAFGPGGAKSNLQRGPSEAQSGARVSQATGGEPVSEGDLRTKWGLVSGEKGAPEEPPLEPNFDASAANRLARAKETHQEYARTYREGPVTRAIATGGFKDNYNMLEGAVPDAAVVKGDKGYETVRAFLKASKNDPDAIGAMADHVLDPLRHGAILADSGALSPSKFAKWKVDYGPAIRAIDEALPGFSDRFASAAKASDAMMEAGRIREQAVDTFQKSEAGKLLGDLGKNEPVEVENAVGKVLTDQNHGPTRMAELVSQAEASGSGALDGLRKAGVDWMLRKFSTTAEAGTSGKTLISGAAFQKFVVDNRAMLGKLYGSDGLGRLAAVAKDLERANRPITATRIKGSPGTAHDIGASAGKHGGSHSGGALSMLGGIIAAHEMGFHNHYALAAGAAASLGRYAINTLRSAGRERADELVRDALLNPERAKLLLSKLPENPDSGKWLALGRSLRRELIAGPAINRSKGKRAK